MTKLKNIFDALTAIQDVPDLLAQYYTMAEASKPITNSRTGVERERLEADLGYLFLKIANATHEARYGNTTDIGNPMPWSSKNAEEYADARKSDAIRTAQADGADIELDNNVAYWTAEHDREQTRDDLMRCLNLFAVAVYEAVRGEQYEYTPYEKKQRENTNIARAVEAMQINKQAKLITAADMLKQAKSA